MQETIQQILNYIHGIYRNRWAAVYTMLGVAIIGWLVVGILPDQYETQARVFVDTDSLLKPLLKGITVDDNVDQQVQLINQTLLSRPTLRKIAADSGLDKTVHSDGELDQLLASLATKIKITEQGMRTNIFAITYENHDPVISHKVVQSVLSTFVNTTLGEAREDSGAAQKFLDQQINDYAGRLNAAEDRLMNFKRKHIGLLPDENGDFYQRLHQTQVQLDQARLDVQDAVSRRDELRRQMRQNTLASGDAGGVRTSVDERITALRQHLDQLLLTFTDKHPDVVEGRRKLAELEAERKAELKRIAEGGTPAASLSDNSALDGLQLAVSQADADVVAKRQRVAELEKRIADLHQQANTLPKIEAELKRLNRDYGVTKQNYETLLQRRESATLSQRVEASGGKVKFRIIDPPLTPSAPTGPNRVKFSTLVLGLAIMAGLGVGFVLAENRPVVHGSADLSTFEGLPLYGIVSMVETPAVVRARKQDMLRLISVFGGLFAAWFVLLVFYYVSEVHTKPTQALLDAAHRFV